MVEFLCFLNDFCKLHYRKLISDWMIEFSDTLSPNWLFRRFAFRLIQNAPDSKLCRNSHRLTLLLNPKEPNPPLESLIGLLSRLSEDLSIRKKLEIGLNFSAKYFFFSKIQPIFNRNQFCKKIFLENTLCVEAAKSFINTFFCTTTSFWRNIF